MEDEFVREVYNINSLIADEMQRKYKIFENVKPELKASMAIDTFYPTILKNNLLDRDTDYRNYTSTFSLTPNISRETNVPLINFEDQVKMLGYTRKDIKDIMIKLKKKEHRIALIGLGGTGSNFLHWANTLMLWTNSVRIFEHITYIDYDGYTTTNLPRIPFTLELIDIKYKTDIYKLFILMSRSISKRSYKININDDVNSITENIIIGAPDFETRKIISKNDKKLFLSLTHFNNEINIYTNPNIDSDILTETYGTIDLSIFFMNQLAATIQLLQYLGDLSEDNIQDITTKEEELFSYNFVEDYASRSNVINGRTFKFYEVEKKKKENQQNV